MEHNIYDANKHINITKIEKLLQENKGKSIVCFGGGSAAEALMNYLLYKYDVEYFLDNNEKIHGSKIMGKEIHSPEILRDKIKGSYIVLIISKHYDVISKQLESYGLQCGRDFYNIFHEFRDYFYIMKFDSMAKKFLSFIERTPRDIFANVKQVSKEKIGIICSCEIQKNIPWFAIGEYLVLKYYGYNAVLIVDNLKSYDDYIYFSEYRNVITIYINYVLNFIKEYFGALDFMYIDSDRKAKLTQADVNQIKIFSGSVLKWLDSRYDEQFLFENENRDNVSEEILFNNLQSIKYFFSQNDFNVISVYTGIHKHRILYSYISKELNIRMSTYDGDVGQSISVETDGATSHAGDIVRLIKEKWFDEEEIRLMVKAANQNYENRANSTINDGGYNFQIVSMDKSNDGGYDVIIPLNIEWDAAALNVDDIFCDYITWLNSTLQYIIENTDATVLIREHPVQNVLGNFRYNDITNNIPILSKEKERIHFGRATEKINTYKCLKECKLVLPYTSTVGLEATILLKPIVTHAKAYYTRLTFGNKATSEKEYYALIEKALAGNVRVTKQQQEEALLAYHMQMFHASKVNFSEGNSIWLDYQLKEIAEWDGVKDIIDVVGNNIPIIYKNLKKH